MTSLKRALPGDPSQGPSSTKRLRTVVPSQGPPPPRRLCPSTRKAQRIQEMVGLLSDSFDLSLGVYLSGLHVRNLLQRFMDSVIDLLLQCQTSADNSTSPISPSSWSQKACACVREFLQAEWQSGRLPLLKADVPPPGWGARGGGGEDDRLITHDPPTPVAVKRQDGAADSGSTVDGGGVKKEHVAGVVVKIEPKVEPPQDPSPSASPRQTLGVAGGQSSGPAAGEGTSLGHSDGDSFGRFTEGDATAAGGIPGKATNLTGCNPQHERRPESNRSRAGNYSPSAGPLNPQPFQFHGERFPLARNPCAFNVPVRGVPGPRSRQPFRGRCSEGFPFNSRMQFRPQFSWGYEGDSLPLPGHRQPFRGHPGTRAPWPRPPFGCENNPTRPGPNPGNRGCSGGQAGPAPAASRLDPVIPMSLSDRFRIALDSVWEEEQHVRNRLSPGPAPPGLPPPRPPAARGGRGPHGRYHGAAGCRPRVVMPPARFVAPATFVAPGVARREAEGGGQMDRGRVGGKDSAAPGQCGLSACEGGPPPGQATPQGAAPSLTVPTGHAFGTLPALFVKAPGVWVRCTHPTPPVVKDDTPRPDTCNSAAELSQEAGATTEDGVAEDTAARTDVSSPTSPALTVPRPAGRDVEPVSRAGQGPQWDSHSGRGHRRDACTMTRRFRPFISRSTQAGGGPARDGTQPPSAGVDRASMTDKVARYDKKIMTRTVTRYDKHTSTPATARCDKSVTTQAVTTCDKDTTMMTGVTTQDEATITEIVSCHQTTMTEMASRDQETMTVQASLDKSSMTEVTSHCVRRITYVNPTTAEPTSGAEQTSDVAESVGETAVALTQPTLLDIPLVRKGVSQLCKCGGLPPPEEGKVRITVKVRMGPGCSATLVT